MGREYRLTGVVTVDTSLRTHSRTCRPTCSTGVGATPLLLLLLAALRINSIFPREARCCRRVAEELSRGAASAGTGSKPQCS